MSNTKSKSAKKALLKKLVKSKSKNPTGASPFKLDNGLGKTPLSPGSGGGSNLGTNGVF